MQVYLRTFSDVENIIDPFTERCTKFEITEQEYYVTSVKGKTKPIRNDNIVYRFFSATDIYGTFYWFRLINVPDEIKEKMKHLKTQK